MWILEKYHIARCILWKYNDLQLEVGGIEPHTRYVAQGLTPYCDHIVTTFFAVGFVSYKYSKTHL
jgi:hypothetical protein